MTGQDLQRIEHNVYRVVRFIRQCFDKKVSESRHFNCSISPQYPTGYAAAFIISLYAMNTIWRD